MKIFAFVFSLLFAINTHAGLITNTSVSGGQFIVDISIDNIEPDTFQFTAEYMFDSSQLELDSYMDSDFLFDNLIGFGSEGVILAGAASTYFVDFIFFEDVSFYGPTLQLGQAVFNILDNTVNPDFTAILAESLDGNGQPTVSASAPSMATLFALVAGLFLVRHRK